MNAGQKRNLVPFPPADSKASEVVERPVYPADLIGSMYELLGIDPDGPMPNPCGLTAQVCPPADPAQKSPGRLREIM